MARPVWTGSLTFGLVTIPVGLYTATQSQGVSFHQLEQQTGRRVRYQRVAEGTDREVAYEDVAKGYETADGSHVLITQEELESVEPGTSRTIDIGDFVELADIDPIYYQRTYYLGPRREEAERPYALLRAAMQRSGRVGIATFVMRGKQYLAAIRAGHQVLSLATMHFADEVRDPRETVDRLPEPQDLPDREVKAAVNLVDQLTTTWEPHRYHDTYREAVLDLVRRKAEGQQIEAAAPGPQEENVVDLMEALQRSIDEASSDRHAKGRSRRTKRARQQEDLSGLTKDELYRRAGQRQISGRSKMTRNELEEALREAS